MAQKISAHRKKLLKARFSKSRRPVQQSLPVLLWAAYASRLEKEIARGFELIKSMLFPVLKNDIETLKPIRADILEDSDKIDKVINLILKKYFGSMRASDEPNLTGYARSVASKIVNPMQAKVDNFSEREFTKTFKRISDVDPLQFNAGLSDLLKVAGKQNINKIVTVNSKYFSDIQDLVDSALRSGTSVSELADSIRKLTDSTKTQSRLIAIDQVQKLNADLEQQRQKNNGITRYIWRTRRNARVRSKGNSNGYSDHAGLEGAIFDYRFPPVTVLKGKRAGERNHPGKDINCKCSAEPVIEDLTGETSKTLEAAEEKTRQLIKAGRIPGYSLPERQTKAA